MSTLERGVPVLDLTGFDPGSEDDARALAQLDAACRDWGFFQITGHGIDPALIAATREQMSAFFAQPREDKLAIERTASNPWGYYDRELTKQKRDWKEIFDFGPPDPTGPFAGAQPQWPHQLPDFEPTMRRFYRACEAVALRLVSAIALNLGVAPSELSSAFGSAHTSFLRLNFYPVCDAPGENLGIHHHTDAGAVTVLLQDDQAGLEVLRDGAWYPLEHKPDALVINIGDVVQVWSNDRYAAPVHRVRTNGQRERLSAPFFLNPAYSASYAPLTGTPRYRPINWGEFRAGRAAGDYGNQGEEIQISQFRI